MVVFECGGCEFLFVSDTAPVDFLCDGCRARIKRVKSKFSLVPSITMGAVMDMKTPEKMAELVTAAINGNVRYIRLMSEHGQE